MIAEVIKKLKPFLNPEKKELAKKTADAVSRLQAKQFFKNAFQNYSTLKEDMKTRLIMELKNISPDREMDFLSLCLADELPQVRALAIKSAISLNDPRLIEKILPLTKDHDPVVRKLSYDFLGMFPLPKIAESLNVILTDETADEPLLALIDAVGNIGNQDSLAPLSVLLSQDRGEKISARLIESIGKLKF